MIHSRYKQDNWLTSTTSLVVLLYSLNKQLIHWNPLCVEIVLTHNTNQIPLTCTYKLSQSFINTFYWIRVLQSHIKIIRRWTGELFYVQQNCYASQTSVHFIYKGSYSIFDPNIIIIDCLYKSTFNSLEVWCR